MANTLRGTGASGGETPEADGGAVETNPGQMQTVEISRLRVGTRLKLPILDPRGVLLLADGQFITQNFLQKLQQRGMLSVQVHASEMPRICAGEAQGTATEVPEDWPGAECELSNAGTEELDAEMLRGQLGLPPQGEALAAQVKQHGATGYNEDLKEEFVGRQNRSVGRMKSVFNDLSAGKGLDVNGLSNIADEAMTDMVQDPDLFAALGINPFSDGYPARHSMHVCMLAIAIGTKLALDRPTLKELAIGCLIHDAGMLKIKQDIARAERPLSPVEFLEITKHPVLVFDMMKDMRAVSQRSAFIAYQIHERCDGSGYPRRRDGSKIHFLSKVAAVADTYVGLVSPRPYRPGLLPYYAVEKLLQGVQKNLFDPAAVKALLKTVSLFPIGSCVQLSDGRVARVVRSNNDAYASPVVEAWEPDELWEPPQVIDLAKSSIRITGPLAGLDKAGETLCQVDADAAQRAEQLASGPAQRRHQRHDVQQQLFIYPCPNGDSAKARTAFTAFSRDVSQSGVGFLSMEQIDTDHIVVEMPTAAQELVMLAKVMRRVRIDARTWEYGVAFTKKLPSDWNASLEMARC